MNDKFNSVYPIVDNKNENVKSVSLRINVSTVSLITGNDKSTLSKGNSRSSGSEASNIDELMETITTPNTTSSVIDIENVDEDPINKRQYWIVFFTKIILCFLTISWIMFYIYYWIFENKKEYIFFAVLIPIGMFILLFPLTSAINSFFNIFGNVNFLTKNSKYFCCIKKESKSLVLPTITIQIPVYNEDFDTVLLPTFESVIIAKNEYIQKGGSCNILINDDGIQVVSNDEALKRINYYHKNNFGYIARPKENRTGKFKKASNMNYCINVSKYYKKIINDGNYISIEGIRRKINKKYPDIIYDGNVIFGDLILLLDSDSRIPVNCLYDNAQLFVIHKDLGYVQNMTTPLNITNNYWEKFICHFTNIIYKYGILYATAGGDAPPLVGHNAFIKYEALEKIHKINKRKPWSEEHVSEDFVFSMMLLSNNYNGKYTTICGLDFLEGVSLNYIDEVLKFKKYAYGSSEMIFNPIPDMYNMGVFNSVITTYYNAQNIPSNSKFMLIAYLGTYFAIGLGIIMVWLNYLIIGFFPQINFLMTTGVDVIVQSGILFSLLVPIGSSLSQYKVIKKGFFKILWNNVKFSFFYILFFSSLNYQIFTSIYGHLFKSKKVGWSTTNKNITNSGRIGELVKTINFFKNQFIFFIISIGLVLTNYFITSPIQITEIYAVLPILLMSICHIIPPFVLNPTLFKLRN